METLKEAALYLGSSARSSTASFSQRRAELLSGRRANTGSLTSANSSWVQDAVAANDVEAELARQQAEKEAVEAARTRAYERGVNIVPTRAVTLRGPAEALRAVAAWVAQPAGLV